jgi:hypothetical protein
MPIESNIAHIGMRISSGIYAPPKNHVMPPAITANCPSPQNKACFSFGCINQRKISNVLKMASAENAAVITEILMEMSGTMLIDIRGLMALFQVTIVLYAFHARNWHEPAIFKLEPATDTGRFIVIS